MPGVKGQPNEALVSGDYMRIVVAMVHELQVKKEPYITALKIADITQITKRRVLDRLEQMRQWGIVAKEVHRTGRAIQFRFTLEPRSSWADTYKNAEVDAVPR